MTLTTIDKQYDLDRAVDILSNASNIAFDIECSSGLHHYINQVCLLQFAADDKVFLIDPLQKLDLSGVGRVLEDGRIEKIMHDTDFDLRSLDRDFGWRPKNLFDTLVAARLCGIKEFGLSSLIERCFGIRTGKKLQKADWTIRPLPQTMLRYAADDVLRLKDLRNLLVKRLEELGRMEWARAEFALCEEKRFESDTRPLFMRVKNAWPSCNGRELAVLKELAIVRDEISRELNIPHFKLIGDKTLIALAKDLPKTIQELQDRAGMHPLCKKRYASRLIEAVKRGCSAPEIKWPRADKAEKRPEYSNALFNKLKEIRAKLAKEYGVDPDLVLSMVSLRRIAGKEPIDDVLKSEPINVWKGSELKKALLKVIS